MSDASSASPENLCGDQELVVVAEEDRFKYNGWNELWDLTVECLPDQPKVIAVMDVDDNHEIQNDSDNDDSSSWQNDSLPWPQWKIRSRRRRQFETGKDAWYAVETCPYASPNQPLPNVYYCSSSPTSCDEQEQQPSPRSLPRRKAKESTISIYADEETDNDDDDEETDFPARKRPKKISTAVATAGRGTTTTTTSPKRSSSSMSTTPRRKTKKPAPSHTDDERHDIIVIDDGGPTNQHHHNSNYNGNNNHHNDAVRSTKQRRGTGGSTITPSPHHMPTEQLTPPTTVRPPQRPQPVTMTVISSNEYLLNFPTASTSSDGLGLSLIKQGNFARLGALLRPTDFGDEHRLPEHGDWVISINGQSTHSLSYQEVTSLLHYSSSNNTSNSSCCVVGFQRSPPQNLPVTMKVAPSFISDYELQIPPSDQGLGITVIREKDVTVFDVLWRPAEFDDFDKPSKGDVVTTINDEVVRTWPFEKIQELLRQNAKGACTIGFKRAQKLQEPPVTMGQWIENESYVLMIPASLGVRGHGIKLYKEGRDICFEDLLRPTAFSGDRRPQKGDVVTRINGKAIQRSIPLAAINEKLEEVAGTEKLWSISFRKPAKKKETPAPRIAFTKTVAKLGEYELHLPVTERGSLGLRYNQMPNGLLCFDELIRQLDEDSPVKPLNGDVILRIDDLDVAGQQHERILSSLKNHEGRSVRIIRLKQNLEIEGLSGTTAPQSSLKGNKLDGLSRSNRESKPPVGAHTSKKASPSKTEVTFKNSAVATESSAVPPSRDLGKNGGATTANLLLKPVSPVAMPNETARNKPVSNAPTGRMAVASPQALVGAFQNFVKATSISNNNNRNATTLAVNGGVNGVGRRGPMNVFLGQMAADNLLGKRYTDFEIVLAVTSNSLGISICNLGGKAHFDYLKESAQLLGKTKIMPENGDAIIAVDGYNVHALPYDSTLQVLRNNGNRTQRTLVLRRFSRDTLRRPTGL